MSLDEFINICKIKIKETLISLEGFKEEDVFIYPRYSSEIYTGYISFFCTKQNDYFFECTYNIEIDELFITSYKQFGSSNCIHHVKLSDVSNNS